MRRAGVAWRRSDPQFVVRLKDGAWRVREEAAWLLGELRPPAAVPVLCAARPDRDADVLASVSASLSRYSDPRAAAPLEHADRQVGEDAPLYVREALVRARLRCDEHVDRALLARQQALVDERRVYELAANGQTDAIPLELRRYLPPPDPPFSEQVEIKTPSSPRPLCGPARPVPEPVTRLLEQMRRYITHDDIIDEPFSGLRDQYRTGQLDTAGVWSMTERYRRVYFAVQRGWFTP